jgi:zinc protease
MKKYLAIFLVVSCFAYASATEVKLPPITEDTLANGLVVVTVENHELPTLEIQLIVRAGSSYDPAGKEGLADFTSSLLRQGTQTRTAVQIAQEIDFVGGSLGASADRDAINATADVLVKHFDTGLDLLADIIQNPVFDTSEIERQRNQILSGIVQAKDDPNGLCVKGFNTFLFDKHPYGHPSEGTSKSVSGITRDDIAKYYSDYFHPNNAFLVVAGDVNPKDVFQRVSKAFQGWKSAKIPVLSITTPPSPDGYKILLVNKPDATQTYIRFGHFGITRQSPDYYPFMLANYILGGSFVSRLNNEVRIKGGMTYDIHTANEWNIMPGAFYCNTFTENDSTMSAIKASLNVIKKMREAEVTDEEYTNAINFYSGFYPMSLETPSQVAREIIKIKLYGLPLTYIQDFTKNVKKVTKADILRVAKKYIDPDNMVFCVVSNAETVQDSLKTLGSVTVKSVDEVDQM